MKKYLIAFKLGFESSLEYRGDFFLSIFSGAFIIIIQCFIWNAVFASAGTTVVNGYTYPEMIAYSILAGIVNKIVSAGFQNEIAGDIKSGGLSKFIVQPIGYFYYRLFCFLGGKVPQLIVLFPLSFGVLALTHYTIGLEISVERLPLFFSFAVLAMLLNFLIYYCLSALAFIMTEVWGIFIAASQAILMLGGGLFPLEVFGDTASQILSLLPFKYLIYYPVNIVTGRMPTGEILPNALIQVAWIFLLLLSRVCWQTGLKKYVAVGG